MIALFPLNIKGCNIYKLKGSIVRSRLCTFRLQQTSSGLVRSHLLRTSASLQLGDLDKSTQPKSVIRGRQYLRGTFEFPGVSPLLDFIHFTCVVCYLVMFIINCSTSLDEGFYLDFSFVRQHL